MKIAQVMTYAPVGLECRPVTVEVAARPGLSSLTFVGLAGRAVAESKERIRIALRLLGIPLPTTSVVVNLAPAELIKNGTHYDLPIALALLQSMGEIPAGSLTPDTVVAGELGLGGRIRSFRQAVSMAIAAQQQSSPLIMPKAVAAEVALVGHQRVALYSNLTNLVSDLRLGVVKFGPAAGAVRKTNTNFNNQSSNQTEPTTFDDITGQTLAKRALTIALAGDHNILLTGPPGVGKSMLIEAAGNLLPALNHQQKLECTPVYSAAGLLNESNPVIENTPVRSPHHRSTVAAIIGGGSNLKPGEISLAHNGLLFLDELPHFRKEVLEALREPLQRRRVIISRLGGSYEYPCHFMLAAAYNPCPCGYWGSGSQVPCRCSEAERRRYLAALSGPILDRFSLTVRCAGVSTIVNGQKGDSEHLAASRALLQARSRQMARQGCLNGSLNNRQLTSYWEDDSLSNIVNHYLQVGGSARSAVSALKVALTIADLANEKLATAHLQEAISWLPNQSFTTF